MDFGRVEVLMVFIVVLALQRQGAHRGRRCSLLLTVSLYDIAIGLFFCDIIETSIWIFLEGMKPVVSKKFRSMGIDSEAPVHMTAACLGEVAACSVRVPTEV